MEANLIEQFFEQGLLVGGLATVCFVLWRSFSSQNEKILQLIENTTKVIEKNTSSFDLLEKVIEKQQEMNKKKEEANQDYWKTRIESQDKTLEDIKTMQLIIKDNLIKQKTS